MRLPSSTVADEGLTVYVATGAVVSSKMVSWAVVEVLKASSLNWA